jgi:MoaA/NifB/PqqE/SkfB family radical SAM enzyme
MKALFNKIRLKYLVATKSFDYTIDFNQRIYKRYLNYDKILHYRDGYPVYSLSTPAMYSKPAANFFAQTLFRSIQNKNLPNMISYAINDVCNAMCAHCSFFTGVDDKSKKVLTLSQAQKLMRDAQELGVSVINFVGGEPLLRDDFPEILQSIDKDLSTALMFTNGFFLEEKAKELKKSGLDSVYVSIDSADAKKHDAFRGKKGLFERAMKGLEKAKSVGLSVGISCTLTPESYKNGELEKMMKLGKEVGVHEIVFFDAMPTGRYKYRKDLVDNPDWVENVITDSKKYNADKSYPGALVWAYATSHRSVGCSCGTSYFYISPYGEVMSCDFNHANFGNVLKTPLYKLWDDLTSKKDFNCAKWGGCKIKDSTFRNKKTVSTGAHILDAVVKNRNGNAQKKRQFPQQQYERS